MSDRRPRLRSGSTNLTAAWRVSERDVGISVETLAVFVRFWLTTTPALPGGRQGGARAQAGARGLTYFVAASGRAAQPRAEAEAGIYRGGGVRINWNFGRGLPTSSGRLRALARSEHGFTTSRKRTLRQKQTSGL